MTKKLKKTIFYLLFLSLGISTAFLIYLHFFAEGDEDPSGEWTTLLNMREQASVAALGWLQDMEAVSVSLEDVEFYMQDLSLRLDLTMERTARRQGTFRCHILPESYEACNQAAYEAFAAAFRELLAERLRMAGYTGAMDEEALEALVTETFGMPTVSYLMSCGPALLPSLEELQTWYDGSGTYETAEGVLIRQFDDGRSDAVREECYIRRDDMLILSGEAGWADSGSFTKEDPIIYNLKEPQVP